MPLLFARGACCAAPAFVEAAGELAGAGVAAGLLAGAAGALPAAGADGDLWSGAALAAVAVAGVPAVELSAEVAFFDLLFLVVAASARVGAVLLAADLPAAELSVASAALLFFDRDFFGVAVSAPVVLFPDDSVVAVLLAVELSAASAVLLALEVLFLGLVVELSDAVVSVLAEVFFLDLEVVVFAESAVASAVLCEPSEAAAFFLVFFFVVALVSVWSLEPEDPDCCAARTVTLPKISSAAATNANTISLLVLILLSPSASTLQQSTLPHISWWLVRLAFGMPCGRSLLECAHHPEVAGGSQG
jgi:hypothetical protein